MMMMIRKRRIVQRFLKDQQTEVEDKDIRDGTSSSAIDKNNRSSNSFSLPEWMSST